MSSFDIDEKLVKKLAKLLEETGLNEIEYEADDKRIRVSSKGAAGTVMMAAQPAAPMAQTSSSGPAAGAAPALPALGQITSPMVGTAYLAAEPGATPFVKVGDRVNKGQTIVIIEAMKVMNPIPAPNGGTVTAIMVSDGQPVEFGEALMVIE